MAEQKTGLVALKDALNAESVKQKFNDLLGKKSAGFITSIISAVSNNSYLQNADRNSIILAASAAASMDLPINPNLGYAAIVPFKDKSGKQLAQMIVMRNGWVELAMRSGQVKKIANEIVYEGELLRCDRFKNEYEFDANKRVSDKVVGYMAYVKLANAANTEVTVYWTVEQCKAHGLRYSQTFKKGTGLWKDSFNEMALKTVLKYLITKYIPKSLEMEMAIERDQAAFEGDIDNPQPVYVDNGGETPATKEQEEFQEAEVVEEKPQDNDEF